ILADPSAVTSWGYFTGASFAFEMAAKDGRPIVQTVSNTDAAVAEATKDRLYLNPAHAVEASKPFRLQGVPAWPNAKGAVEKGADPPPDVDYIVVLTPADFAGARDRPGSETGVHASRLRGATIAPWVGPQPAALVSLGGAQSRAHASEYAAVRAVWS